MLANNVGTATLSGRALVRTALSFTVCALTGTDQYSRETVPSFRW